MKDRLEVRQLNHDEELREEETKQWPLEDELEDRDRQIKHLKGQLKREQRGYGELAAKKEALMDDNAELRKNIGDLFALYEVYEVKNFFPTGKYR